jgi:hypothetical protein
MAVIPDGAVTAWYEYPRAVAFPLRWSPEMNVAESKDDSACEL